MRIQTGREPEFNFLVYHFGFLRKKYYLDKDTPDKKLLRKVTVCKNPNLAKNPNLTFNNARPQLLRRGYGAIKGYFGYFLKGRSSFKTFGVLLSMQNKKYVRLMLFFYIGNFGVRKPLVVAQRWVL